MFVTSQRCLYQMPVVWSWVVGRKDGVPEGNGIPGERMLTSPVCKDGIIAGLVGGLVVSNGGKGTRAVICSTFTVMTRGAKRSTLRMFGGTVSGVVPILRIGTEEINKTGCRMPIRIEPREERALNLE